MTRTGVLSAGSRLAGRYHIEACIGTGATSTVYRALDLRTRDAVALKILDPLLARDEVSLERFSREMRALRAVAHPHVVRVFALDRDDDVWFLSMAFIDGPTLKAHLEKKGRLSARELVTFGSKLASGLDMCHRAGVVHRDVKPGNIMLEASTEPKLVDFGVAAVCTASHLTRTGTYLGTPDYMAPEQFVKATADPRSDLFSLGVVLYESLTDRLPYHARSIAGIAEREDIVPPSHYFPEIPAWLDAIVVKCLEPSPENRYQSAWELGQDFAKGAQSLAQYGRGNARRICLRCRAAMVHGLQFCHQCGTLVIDHFEPGNRSVVLYRCDDTEDFAERVSALGAVSKPAAVLKRLGTLPRVLMRGVDESTARAVVSELFGARAELGVATTLPKELRLPRHYLGYGLVAFAGALALGNLVGILSVLVGVVSSYTVFFALLRSPGSASHSIQGAFTRRYAPIDTRIGRTRSQNRPPTQSGHQGVIGAHRKKLPERCRAATNGSAFRARRARGVRRGDDGSLRAFAFRAIPGGARGEPGGAGSSAFELDGDGRVRRHHPCEGFRRQRDTFLPGPPRPPHASPLRSHQSQSRPTHARERR